LPDAFITVGTGIFKEVPLKGMVIMQPTNCL